ncbi:hypothetical protein RJT34_24733 [Clitoria ternatea]|uniref:Uncharacterized protein n=1 Tax=Clitoria ternatea TaxID=43366 RepID=A0AAN9FR96_CLITE
MVLYEALRSGTSLSLSIPFLFSLSQGSLCPLSSHVLTFSPHTGFPPAKKPMPKFSHSTNTDSLTHTKLEDAPSPSMDSSSSSSLFMCTVFDLNRRL